MPSRSVALLSLLCLPLSGLAAEHLIADRDSASLVRAMQAANRSATPTVIQLAAGGLYTLEITDSAQRGLPPVRGDVTLYGNGAEIRRYSSGTMLLLDVEETGRLRVEHLTLAEGSGGALRNRGEVELRAVSIVDSSSDSGPAVVLNHGVLRAYDSEFGYNRLRAATGPAGIILNHGELHLQDCSIHGNQASHRDARAAIAAAVMNLGEMTVSRLQLDDNSVSERHLGARSDGVLQLGEASLSGDLPLGSR